MLDIIMHLLDVKCEEGSRHPYRTRLCILKVFAEKGSCVSFKEILQHYRYGEKGHLRKVIRYLEDKGLIKRITDIKNKEVYCLTVRGHAIASTDPPCPMLFLAGADVALRVAYESNIEANWLLSAGRYWKGDKFGGYEKDLTYVKMVRGLLFLDSGAQQFYRKFRGFKYPYTAKQYLDFAELVNADLIATLDLPLDILVPRGLNISEGIKQSVEYSMNVIAEAEYRELLHKIVPVLQGFNDPSQWLECLDLYKQHGVTPQKFRVWGIGSLCMTRSSKLTETVVREIKKSLGKNIKIHVFGINLKHLRKVFNIIDSYDTSAWIYWSKIDGAVLIWSPRRNAFIHLQSRKGYRYDTETLMEINLRQILTMHEHLCRKIVTMVQNIS